MTHEGIDCSPDKRIYIVPVTWFHENQNSCVISIQDISTCQSISIVD